jgi:type IV pilus assembly protein PilB
MAAIAFNYRKRRLGELLVTDGIITEEQLSQATEHQQRTNCFLGQAIVTLGFATPAQVGDYIEEALGFPYIDLSTANIDTEVARSLSEALARKKLLLPFAVDEDAVHVAMADPLDLAVVDDLRARLNRRVHPFVAFENDLREAIGRVYDPKLKTQSVIDEITLPDVDPELSVDALLGMAEDAPIVRLVNSIIQSAISSGASDIHIEPQENAVRVRFRQDGLLYEQALIPRHHLAAVVSRIKIMGQMNIAERRRPQDGRIVYREENGNQFDLRVSIMPVMYGEKIVMRLLAKSGSFGNVNKLGFFPEQRELFDRFIHRPHGIMLVTGPTGSGKSTTLFAALNQINDSTRNINTVEDPVEYNLPGVNQMQVNPQIGVTFAAGLRTLLRQDPDVVMVGEIRDRETAEIAIQAALTGHLVLSTLHTNDAAGALTRLQNMGVEPFLISSAITGVIGQRLLRMVCPNCKEMVPASRAVVDGLGIKSDNPSSIQIASGRGCAKCGGRGMKGRTAVYEIMPMTDRLKEMVLNGDSSAHFKTQAIAEGMLTMKDAGIKKVLMGQTTPDEVLRVLCAEEG